MMICRLWRGWTTGENASAYEDLLRKTLRRVSEESMTLDVTGHYHRAELFDFRPLRIGRRPAGEGE